MSDIHTGHKGRDEASDSALLSFLVKARHFVINHTRLVIMAGTGLVIAGIVIAVLVMNAASNEQRAATAFEKVALMLQGEGARDKIGDIDKKLEEIIKTWPGTLASAKAALNLADIQYRMENFAGAIENFSRVRDYGSSTYLYPSALLGIGNCHEQSGEMTKAVDYYESVASLTDHFGFKDLALLGKARCLGAQGKIDEARKVLENVRSDTSAFGDEAMRLSIWLEAKKTAQVLPAGK